MPSARTTPFHLLRWFAGLGALVVALIGLANGWLMSSFLTTQLLQREAVISREFVQNVLSADGSLGYLADPQSDALRQRFLGSIEHLLRLKGVLRANVYGRDRSVLWSTDGALIGKRFSDNDDLERALAGELVVEGGPLSERQHHEHGTKGEHQGLSPDIAFFIETYIPVHAVEGGPVVGAVEIYKAPQALTQAIRQGRQQVALAALVGALLLYASLFWLVARADRTLRRQQAQLREAETSAATAELAASVAHNIRNPLASIRSSAELTLDAPGEHAAENANDILLQVDRIATRIDELLRLGQTGPTEQRSVDLARLLQDCVQEHRPGFARRQQQLHFDNALAAAPGTPAAAAGAPAPTARTDAQLLRQALHSLLANASEAMAEGQTCWLRLQAAGPGHLRVQVQDDGPGLPAAQLAQAMRPFFTTKPQGLGLGLSLVQRIVDRLGGRLQLQSQPGQGTTVSIELPRG